MGIKIPSDHLGRCSAPVSVTRLESLRGQGAQLTSFALVSLRDAVSGVQ